MVTASSAVARRMPVDIPRIARLSHALSDETRLAVLELLRYGERCVCDLQVDLDVGQSRLSFHLKVLRDAGLILDRREGRWAFYTIAPTAIDELHDLVITLRPRSGALPVIQEKCCG